MRFRQLILTAALTLLVTAPLHAQVYRWVDDDGEVHYADQAPPGVDAELVPIDIERTDPAEVESRLESEVAAVDDAASARRERAAERGELEARRAERRRTCERARSTLSQMENQRRIAVSGGDGTEFWTPEERLRRLEEARGLVAENCD